MVPTINFENDKVVSEVLEVPIIVNGESKIVKMTKITSGKKREIIKKYVKTGMSNQQMRGEITDLLGIQINTLSEVIIEAPFSTTEKALSDLPEEIVDYLYNQYEEWTKKKSIGD